MANIKVNRWLGHDLDLDGLYFAQAANNTVHDITTQDISISAWVKVDSNIVIGTYYVMGKWDITLNKGYIFYLHNLEVGKLRIRVKDGTNDYYVSSSIAINDNKWHHITGITDRDSSANSGIYIDGVLDTGATKTGTISSVGSLANSYILGLGTNSGNLILDGQISSVRIYIANGDTWDATEIANQAKESNRFCYDEAIVGTLTDKWPCDEGSGLTLNGKVNNLTLSNALAWSTQAKLKINPILGHDLDLDGLYFAQAANNTVLDVTTEDICISAWVKEDTNSGNTKTIFSKWVSANDGYILRHESSGGKLRLDLWDNGNYYLIVGSINLFDNKWHHIACVIDRDNAANCKLYVDGVSETLTAYGTLGNIVSLTNTGIAEVGDDIFSATIDGQISSVRIYIANGDTWDATEIANQAKESNRFCYDESIVGPLTDYWRCDEGSGLTLYGKVNNLTLSNALAWSTQAKTKVTPGLVGWWKMDDNAGNATVVDYSGKGNNGTFSDATGDPNTSAHTAAGQIGAALTFDGVDDYVGVADTTNFSFTTGGGNDTPASFSAWIKVGSFANTMSIASKVAGTPWRYEWQFVSQADLGIGLTLFNSSATAYIGRYAPFPSTGIWHHICGTYDGTKLIGGIKVYIDGIRSDTTNALAGTYSGCTNTTAPISIGRQDWGGYYFSGLIDNVKIWNYARSSEQILQDYNRGLLGRE